MQSIEVSEPFELLGMDIVGKLPTSAKGYKFILVMTDHLSKWAYAVPLAEITSIDVATAIMEKVVLEGGHGPPQRILTDQASNFNSALAHEFYKMLGIAKSSTSAYHPQCDGHTEKFNDTLCHMIAKLMEEHPLDWAELLPYCVYSYNIARHASTGFFSYYIQYGQETRLPLERAIGSISKTTAVKLSTYVQ